MTSRQTGEPQNLKLISIYFQSLSHLKQLFTYPIFLLLSAEISVLAPIKSISHQHLPSYRKPLPVLSLFSPSF